MKLNYKRKAIGKLEYALLIALISIFSLSALSFMGVKVQDIFFNSAQDFYTEQNGLGAGSTAGSGSGTGSTPGSGASSAGSSVSQATPAQFVWSTSALGGFNTTVALPSSTQTISVQNIGGTAGTTGNATISGANASRFAVMGNTCTSTVQPNETCLISVRANAGPTGSYVASISVTGITGSIDLSGNNAASPAQFVWSTAPLTGFDTTLLTPSSIQTVTVQNIGGMPGTVGNIAFGGVNASRFGLAASTCTAFGPIQPNATCTYSIRANAGPYGNYVANISVPGITGSISLSGSNLTDPAPDCLAWSTTVSPPNLSRTMANAGTFGRANPVSASMLLRLRNTCAEPQSDMNPTLVQNRVTPHGSISITTNECVGVTLQQNENCRVIVSLNATRNDDYSGILYGLTQPTSRYPFNIDAQVSTQAAPNWTATLLNLNPGTVGVVYTGSSNSTWTYTDPNNDMSTTNAAQQLVSGALPPGLSLITPSLNASSQSSGLQGTPTTAGNYSFTTRITDRSGNSAERTLNITINPAPPPVVTLSSVNFGAVSISTPVINRTVVVTNNTGQTISTGPATFYVCCEPRISVVNNLCGATLAPGAFCNIFVRLTRNSSMANGPVGMELYIGGAMTTVIGSQN